jgi:hypothetical protein
MSTADQRQTRYPPEVSSAIEPTTGVSERVVSRGTERRAAQAFGVGAMVGGVCGLGAVVLTIIGLAGTYPMTLSAISVIVLGASLLIHGASLGVPTMQSTDWETPTHRSGGVGVATATGLATVILGVLSLLDIFPFPLNFTICAVIVFGAGLLLTSGMLVGFGTSLIGTSRAGRVGDEFAAEMVNGAAGTQLLVGLAAVVLGILALVGHMPLTLSLVGLLIIGCSVLLTSGAWGTRLLANQL